MNEGGENLKPDSKEVPLAPAGSDIHTLETDTIDQEKLNFTSRKRRLEAQKRIDSLKKSRGEAV